MTNSTETAIANDQENPLTREITKRSTIADDMTEKTSLSSSRTFRSLWASKRHCDRAHPPPKLATETTTCNVSVLGSKLLPIPSLTRTLSSSWTISTTAPGIRTVATKLGPKKKRREYSNLVKAQQLLLPLEMPKHVGPGPHAHAHDSEKMAEQPIFALDMSPDGLYLAAGGQDKIVWVWTILIRKGRDSPAEEVPTSSGCSILKKNTTIRQPTGYGSPEAELADKIGVFASRPICIFKGHTAGILSLAWSVNKFLVSSSMDGTVRLWNVERNHCLGVFKHPDIPTSVCFHPTDNRFFLSGCLDKTIRLWSLPDKDVAFSCKHTDMITAVGFSPQGTVAVAGTFNGVVILHHTKELQEFDRFQVSSKLLNDKSSLKITGIRMFRPPTGSIERTKMLVSSNNSRVRIFDYETLSLDAKYKGAVNKQSQTIAEISPDRNHVICPSEDGRVYIWDTDASDNGGSASSNTLLGGKDNLQYESWRVGTGGSVTCASFAPFTTKHLLWAYNDFIYRSAANACRGSPTGDAESVRQYRGILNSLDIVIASTSKGQVFVYRQMFKDQPSGRSPPLSPVGHSVWKLQSQETSSPGLRV